GALPRPVLMVRIHQYFTSCMNGTSLKPCTTASLCISATVSCLPILGMARHKWAGRLKLLLSQLPGRFCAPREIASSSSITPGQPMPMKGGQVQALLFGASNELAQHLDQPFYSVVAPGLVVDVAPLVKLPRRGLREIRRAFQIELDDAGAEIGAAEISGEDGVVAL